MAQPNRSSCPPYRFSNDHWSRAIVGELQERLQAQSHAPEKGAALMLGAGGLPYILGRPLRISTICNVDLYTGVLATTRGRTALLQSHDNWGTYHRDVAARFCDTADRALAYVREQHLTTDSGLQGDFAKTREQAASIDIRSYVGDIRERATEIGQWATANECAFSLVNVTNVAGWMGSRLGELAGMQVMHDTLSKLPLAADAVIIDSSPDLQPALYTPQEYAQAVGA